MGKTTQTVRTIKSKPLFRYAVFLREKIDESARTVELAFSSEEPVERWFGKEILDHSKSSVRLGRLQDSGPILVDHNTSDHVGVVESVSVDGDRRGRAVVRFGESGRASEIFNDVVAGIRTKVSVGYRIHKLVLEEQTDEGDTYRVTDWEPYEISIVSVPADPSVGIGRELEETENSVEVESIEQEQRSMQTEQTATPAAPAAPVDVASVRAEGETRGVTNERDRAAQILAIGDRYGMNDLAREFVNAGKTVDQMREAALERIASVNAVEAEAPDVGMSEREVQRFSFVRAIHALANPTDKRAQENAAFEIEASHAQAEKLHRESRGLTVPVDVLKRAIDEVMYQRDLVVGTATAGGHTVSTDLFTGSFIEMLRNKAFMLQPGMATLLTDLNGNIAIPRQTGGATAYWVAESGAPNESQQAFDQVALSPETVGAFTDFSRKLMLQSSIDVEAFVRADLARVIALEIDRVSIHGSGSGNEPTGILNATGIGDVAGGTNGAAPTWANIVDLETEVAIDNADMGSLRYLTNAKVRGKLKKTFVDPGSNAERVWDTRAGNTPLNGYESLVTNQVSSTLDKGTSTGVCSAIIFGNFADLFIGMWGGLDLTIDPFTSSTSGTIRVVALQDMDLAVRHAQSFAAMQDALTA